MTDIVKQSGNRNVDLTPVPGAGRFGSVAAVIVTRNRHASLRRLLCALATQTYPVQEIIVVDNASNDETAAMLRADFRHVTHLLMHDNTGAAGGFARGMEFASGRGVDWIWLFSDDQWPDQGALATLLECEHDLGREAPTLMACWLLRHPEGQIRTRGCRWRRGRATSEWSKPARMASSNGGPPPTPVATEVVTFLGALVGREVVTRIGVPRADFFMGMYEIEYCLRALRAGVGVFVVPEPLVLLDAERDEVVRPPWRGYYQSRNHLIMALESRSVAEIAWWFFRQMKLSVGSLRLDHRGERVRLRLLGGWHAARGITGRTMDPDTGGLRKPRGRSITEPAR